MAQRCSFGRRALVAARRGQDCGGCERSTVNYIPGRRASSTRPTPGDRSAASGLCRWPFFDRLPHDGCALWPTVRAAPIRWPGFLGSLCGRCFKAVDLLPSRSQGEPSTRVREAMIIQVLHCPYCQGIDIVRHGLSPEGKQRFRCRTCLEGRGRTFLLDYSYAGQSPAVKQQIVDMAMNASGIRDTARVLHVSPTTVINELKVRLPLALWALC